MKFSNYFVLSLLFLSGCGAVKESHRMQRYQDLSQSNENLRRLGLAIKQYSFDYEGKFPPMQSSESLKKALKAYSSPELFVSPLTGRPYKINSTLSFKNMDKIKSPASVAMLYEDQAFPGPNSPKELYRPTAFVDLHVKTVDEKIGWPRVKQQSAIAN